MAVGVVGQEDGRCGGGTLHNASASYPRVPLSISLGCAQVLKTCCKILLYRKCLQLPVLPFVWGYHRDLRL
eukprot:1144734-Pelagomonas_calceolata.AAC.2